MGGGGGTFCVTMKNIFCTQIYCNNCFSFFEELPALILMVLLGGCPAESKRSANIGTMLGQKLYQHWRNVSCFPGNVEGDASFSTCV